MQADLVRTGEGKGPPSEAAKIILALALPVTVGAAAQRNVDQLIRTALSSMPKGGKQRWFLCLSRPKFGAAFPPAVGKSRALLAKPMFQCHTPEAAFPTRAGLRNAADRRGEHQVTPKRQRRLEAGRDLKRCTL